MSPSSVSKLNGVENPLPFPLFELYTVPQNVLFYNTSVARKGWLAREGNSGSSCVFLVMWESHQRCVAYFRLTFARTTVVQGFLYYCSMVKKSMVNF